MPITAFTYLDAHKHGSIVSATHKLRHKAFIQRMNYAVPTWQGMEYDQYDNITAVQLVYRLTDELIGGTVRLAPTDRPYMIKDLWPHIVTKIELPSSPTIWEASRLCVDQNLPAVIRKRIISEMVMGYQEYCLFNKIEYMIGVMPPKIWERVFFACGWEIEFIGPETKLEDGEVIIAGKLNISEFIYRKIMATTGIGGPIIENLSRENLLPAKMEEAA